MKKSFIIIVSLLAIHASAQVKDSVQKVTWNTTIAKEKIISVSLLLTKQDGSIFIIDSAWKMNVRKDVDKVAVIYPDSTRVVYRVVDRSPKDTIITIPFSINKKVFDAAKNIKLEIIK